MPDTINFEELVPRLEKREQFETIKKAYEYAYNEHKGMKRLTGDDFITHPLEVTKILILPLLHHFYMKLSIMVIKHMKI
mgnify:CR=1 FL=1